MELSNIYQYSGQFLALGSRQKSYRTDRVLMKQTSTSSIAVWKLYKAYWKKWAFSQTANQSFDDAVCHDVNCVWQGEFYKPESL